MTSSCWPDRIKVEEPSRGASCAAASARMRAIRGGGWSWRLPPLVACDGVCDHLPGTVRSASREAVDDSREPVNASPRPRFQGYWCGDRVGRRGKDRDRGSSGQSRPSAWRWILNRGEPVSSDRLNDALWREQAPPSAINIIQMRSTRGKRTYTWVALLRCSQRSGADPRVSVSDDELGPFRGSQVASGNRACPLLPGGD